MEVHVVFEGAAPLPAFRNFALQRKGVTTVNTPEPFPFKHPGSGRQYFTYVINAERKDEEAFLESIRELAFKKKGSARFLSAELKADKEGEH